MRPRTHRRRGASIRRPFIGRRGLLADGTQSVGEFAGGFDDGGHEGTRPWRAHAQRGRADQHRGDDLARGVTHRGGDADRSGHDLGVGDQEAALADPVQIAGDPGRVSARRRRVALQPLRQHLGLHGLRRMGQQQPAAPRMQRHALADLGVDPQAGIGLVDRDGLGLHPFSDPEIDVFSGRVAEGGEIRHRGGGQSALLGRGAAQYGPSRAEAPKPMARRPG